MQPSPLSSLIYAILLLTGSLCLGADRLPAKEPPQQLTAFFKANCYECHQGADAEAGFDLAKLGFDLADAKVHKQWVRLFDRVQQGEMPPVEASILDPQAKAGFLQAARDWLRQYQLEQDARFGRVQARRLTRREIERSLHDLLGIDIPLADQLPEESRSSGFTTVADGQAMSHFQLERHLSVVDLALDEAFRRSLSPSDPHHEELEAREVARRDSRRRTREPEMLDGRAVTWSSGLIFYGRLPATTAPADGWYRFRVRLAGLKLPESGGVWTTVRSGLCVSSAPLLAYITAFEATEQPREIEFEAWLPQRHMLEIRPGDTTLKKARFAGGQVGSGEGDPQNVPGIAIEHITMERIHHGPGDGQLRRLLFGDLTAQTDKQGKSFAVESSSPREDAVRLIEAFAHRAFRRPVTSEQLAGYTDLALAALDEGKDLAAALRVGYRAVLCSPRFLYLTESPGRLDDYAVAARLSYLLTGNTPDARLTQLAAAGELHEPATLRAEADRLLSGTGGRRFIEDFAAQWLDLDQIDFTEPDRKLFPDFDAIVQNSMLNETHTYLETMLRENTSVVGLIDSDFTYLNSRLARFYDIDGVEGDALRRVDLPPHYHRGGLLTQGAILKVTANGTNTSPVIRGVWVSERLLGEKIPPPPDNVPAIEPDIRGATTIREMLAKHRSQAACASCHVKIDPPGFALENFDPAGQWRDRYAQLIDGRRETGAKIDASYVLPDGREFAGVDEFRRLIAAQPETIARAVAKHLLVYGTGAPISFADRQVVEAIVAEAKKHDYGLRSIVHAVVASPTFLSK